MISIHAYLTFNGNCREAMTFYQKCLGGRLNFQTLGESPLSAKMPARMKKCILNSKLKSEKLTLMGSDMVDEIGVVKGNSVSLVLCCNSEKKIRSFYNKLSEGGEQTHPLKMTYWNELFGELTDKFGNRWMLYYERKYLK